MLFEEAIRKQGALQHLKDSDDQTEQQALHHMRTVFTEVKRHLGRGLVPPLSVRICRHLCFTGLCPSALGVAEALCARC